MEDGGLGSLIFYIILGIIALAGSFQGKNKKTKTLPKKPVQRQADTVTRTTAARTTQAYPAATPVRPAQTRPVTAQRRPQYMPVDPSMEGRYEEPLAGSFSGEGSIGETMAEAFSGEGSIGETMAEAFIGEGSVIDTMAGAFADEGSIESSMAAAFASEGSSSFRDFQTGDFIHTEISDSEIGDAPEYDYNSRPGSDILDEGFDVKKALIYSAVLNRKEYFV
ncbi:MAG: hypothetical protein WAV93_05985 [Bacteroidales bacterium]